MEVSNVLFLEGSDSCDEFCYSTELVSQCYFNLWVQFQIGDLKPDTSYIFLVRAENSHGVSVPSPVSNVVRTLGADRRAVPKYELDEARARLGTKVVQLRDVQPISSTSVRLMWEVSHMKGNVTQCLSLWTKQNSKVTSCAQGQYVKEWLYASIIKDANHICDGVTI